MNTAGAALDGGLDTATVLRELHRIEIEPGVASGCKFAAFAHLDRMLGLDLTRLVHKLRR